MNRAAQMTAFVRAVETGGFSAAARDLGLTPSALSKLVTRLEDRLGARLRHRTTRRLQLTAEGEAFYARARPILAAMAEAEAEVSRLDKEQRSLLEAQLEERLGKDIHVLRRLADQRSEIPRHRGGPPLMVRPDPIAEDLEPLVFLEL